MSDHNEHEINEAILNYVNGGTKEKKRRDPGIRKAPLSFV